MPIHFDNQQAGRIHFNGQEMARVYFGNQLQFRKATAPVYPDGISFVRVSSNSRAVLITFDGAVRYQRFTASQWAISDDGTALRASGATVRRGNQILLTFTGGLVAEGSAMTLTYTPSGGANRRVRVGTTAIASFTHSWTDDRTAPSQTGWSAAQNRDLTLVFDEALDADHLPNADELSTFYIERSDNNAEVPITRVVISGNELTLVTNGFGDIRSTGFFVEYLGWTTAQTGLSQNIPLSRRIQDRSGNVVGPFDFEFIP